ncbi:hypothetical protein J7E91_19225 [Streptomyces sp. ISL-99]|uniref:hypothetical protein n=1 Tax=Streptomyces sp. ISL-99 TaxID=2819193 RepID=UPI001BE534D4|nr:hypothetical protein [Streptomyces sp. ISL-99]MBT2527497.1 hypothetical protein [Streptomyces sp. ISL-99]
MTGVVRGRAAAFPPSGYAVPERVGAGGLVVVAVSQEGEELGVYDFRDSAGPAVLRAELVAAFAASAPPRGTWTSRASCQTAFKALRQFLRFVGEQYPQVEGACDVSPMVWRSWTAASPGRMNLRPLLLKTALPQATGELLRTRTPRPAPVSGVVSYTVEEFTAVRRAALASVRRAHERIAQGRGLLERWRQGQLEPQSEEGLWGWALDQVARTADAPRIRPQGEQAPIHARLRPLVAGQSRAGYPFWVRLFFTFEEMGAAAVALACADGWNLTPLATMYVPDLYPNGEAGGEEPVVQRVATYKARRTERLRHATNNLVDAGEGSAGRVMRQVVFCTEQARATQAAMGTPNTRLLIARRTRPRRGEYFAAGPVSVDAAVRRWARTVAPCPPDGVPVAVSIQRLHRTVQTLFGGPRHNTPKVSDEVYRLRDPHVRAGAPAVIAQGLTEALDHAQARLAMRLVRGTEEGLLVRETGLDPGTARRLGAGRLDTAVGACTDFAHSPFTPNGPCTVSFLLCFACPNALSTERHLPRILYLHQAIEQLRATVSPAVWHADWAAHLARISDLLRRHTRTEEHAALRQQLTDDDRRLIDRMLDRRLDG